MGDASVAALPFLWGAQYYRAPTPAAEHWQADLEQMRRLGFTDIKVWAQWRWSHRHPERFVFDDLDRLCDLAHGLQLRVTINTIFDVAPIWLFTHHADARQVTADGRMVEPRANGCRQIGGMPGPCLRHPQAQLHRQHFLRATVERFRSHPALAMWDVWNEPEQSFFSRDPRPGTYVCYCAWCREAFITWLAARHRSLEDLNRRWGRCYQDWREVEAPLIPDTIVDWIDWREFHLDGMTAEAAWRLAMVADLDASHPAYLHVVPNTMDCFNAISGVDDFALAALCPFFAATCNGGPQWMHQLVSPAPGKRAYNVESHVNFGSTTMHPRLLGLGEVTRDLLPQIGLGITGFLFWQFRAETLGVESPAWGVVHPDGSDRPVTVAIEAFGRTMLPYRDRLLTAHRDPPRIAIWKSRRNEIFHHAIHTGLQPLIEAVDGYVQALYWQSLPFRFINETMLESGDLADIQLLIMPSPYCLSLAEAEGLDAFLRRGGHCISEAHLGGWDPATGRHSARCPGHGLDQRWGVRELDSTSAFHLGALASAGIPAADAGGQGVPAAALSDDVRKALQQSGAIGGQYFAMQRTDGPAWWGSDRVAVLGGPGLVVSAHVLGMPCMGTVEVGRGRLIYVGTRWGQAAVKDRPLFAAALARLAADAGILPTAHSDGAGHVDVLRCGTEVMMVIVVNPGETPLRVRAAVDGGWRALFQPREVSFADGLSQAPHSAEAFVPADR